MANQRRRILHAVAAVVAQRGYLTFTVADITDHARVSRATFYHLFDNKEQCLLAAYDEFCDRLLAAIDESCGRPGSVRHRVAAAVHAALDYLASDVAVAQLLTVYILAAGDSGAQRHKAILDDLVNRLWALSAGPARSGNVAAARAVAFAATLVGQSAIDGSPAILALEDEVTEILV